MSSYYSFDQAEALLTSTTTAATMVSTDAIIVHNVATNKKFQTTPGALASQMLVTTNATTNTSGTAISPYGVTKLLFAPATALTSFAWQLQDPPSAGLCKIIYMSSTTSSGNIVNFVSATGLTSAISNAAFVAMGTAAAATVGGGTFIELTSVSTSVWLITGKSSANTFFA